jgi:ketoreductase RED2
MTTPVAIVTGSSSGIGEAVARAFAATGAGVVINSSRSVAEGEAIAAALPDACYVQADVADPEGPQRVVDAALARWGRIDTLVNNAGTTALIPHHDLGAASVDVWRRIFEVNVFATWAMTVAALPALKEAKGSVVNVSSVAGLRPTGSSIPYAASKAAVNHGLIDTPWTADWELQRQAVQQMTPLKRVGEPQDVAEVVLALATASYVTGQVVAIDGGLTLAV